MKSIISTHLLFVAGAITLFSCQGKPATEAGSIFAEEAIPVKSMQVGRSQTTDLITATGLLTTVKEASYSFKIGGVIERINSNEGQHFKKGQLLATLKIAEIDAQLAQASLGVEKAARDYTRAANLYKDSVATLEQLQNAKTALEMARKTVDVVMFNKKYAYIYANADGFVTRKIANEGEVISSGMPVLAIHETSGSSDWVLKLGVTDKQWSALETGHKATVTLDAFPGKIFSATVFRKSQSADQGTGALLVEVMPELGSIKPAIGMFGKASIYTAATTSLPVVPYDAILEADGNNAFVFVPAENNRVKKVPVLIESFNNEAVVIKSGLENVPTIIVSNSAFLNEKSIIKIIK